MNKEEESSNRTRDLRGMLFLQAGQKKTPALSDIYAKTKRSKRRRYLGKSIPLRGNSKHETLGWDCAQFAGEQQGGDMAHVKLE